MVLEFENITVSFKSRGKTLYYLFRHEINAGEITSVTGASGSGKTTLLHALLGFVECDGLIRYHGIKPGDVYFAPCEKSLVESLCLYENMKLLQARFGGNDKISDILAGEFGIPDIYSYPRELSSGQYKRAVTAGGILSGSPFLFLDEPTSNLDEKSASVIASGIRRFADNKKSVLVATHDKRIMEIADKRIEI